MDDAKLSCGKDSAQKVDATYLPLVCPAAASGRFLPVVKGYSRPKAALHGPVNLCWIRLPGEALGLKPIRATPE